jgi:hypothetical protein
MQRNFKLKMISYRAYQAFIDVDIILHQLSKCHKIKEYRMKSFIQFCSIWFTLSMEIFSFVPVGNFILDCKVLYLQNPNSEMKQKLQNSNIAVIQVQLHLEFKAFLSRVLISPSPYPKYLR